MDKLRHAVYWTTILSTIGPILLLEACGKLANRMEWVMWDLRNWAYPPSKARRPGQ